MTNTIDLLIFYRMKVTAILPDVLISEVKSFSGGKNITDSLQKALTEWVKNAKIKKLNQKIETAPLSFQKGYSANSIRNLNRKS